MLSLPCHSTLTHRANSPRWQTRTLPPPSQSSRPRSPHSSKPSTPSSQLRSSNTSNTAPQQQTRRSRKPGLTSSLAMSYMTSCGVSTLFLLPQRGFLRDLNREMPLAVYLKTAGIEPAAHPVMQELVRRPGGWYALAGDQLSDPPPTGTLERVLWEAQSCPDRAIHRHLEQQARPACVLPSGFPNLTVC